MIKVRSTEYVIFDVETTGLAPLDGDRIIEIAAVKIKNGQTIDQYQTFVNPQRPLPPETVQFNKITEEMVAGAPTADEVLPQIIDFTGGACLVGHNVRFDLGFLCYELSLIGRRLREETPVVDTLKMAKGLIPYLNSYKLSYLALSLGITVNETHRAMADVELTAAVFRKLTDIASDQKIDQLSALLEQFSVDKPVYPIRQVAQSSLF